MFNQAKEKSTEKFILKIQWKFREKKKKRKVIIIKYMKDKISLYFFLMTVYT